VSVLLLSVTWPEHLALVGFTRNARLHLGALVSNANDWEVALEDKNSANPDSRLATGFVASPNHGPRRPPKSVDAIVLHYTGMPTADSALERLCDPASEVSSHYFVDDDGRILQLVRENRRAWHAGVGSWKDETDMNSVSIGIEIANQGHDGGSPPYPDAQIQSVIKLCLDICERHRILPERVLAHSDIAPTRKRDPGEYFPWERLALAGVGAWSNFSLKTSRPSIRPGSKGDEVRALQELLTIYGYHLDITGDSDAMTRAVLVAFQRHFRPNLVDGTPDASTVSILCDLVARFGGRSG
jgi:N-acetylmuramoyl-L-alanine amidase